MTPFREQAGMSLVEVLVAVLVLSIGLLGLAGVQLQSMKYSQASQWRSQANFLAYDIVERIRANRPNIADYGLAMDASKPVSRNTMAQDDLYLWMDQIETTLPGGDGAVTWDAATMTLTVQIQADDQARITQAGNAAAPKTTLSYVTRMGGIL